MSESGRDDPQNSVPEVHSDHDHDAVSSQRGGDGEAPQGDRRQVDPGSERSSDLRRSPSGDGTAGEASADGRVSQPGDKDYEPQPLEDQARELAPYILAQVQQNLFLPVQMPDADQLAHLKATDRDAYEMWMRNVDAQMTHDREMQKREQRSPFEVIRRGQRYALASVLVLTLLTGYAMYLDQAWLAGIFGVLDFVGVIAAFTGGGSGENDDA